MNEAAHPNWFERQRRRMHEFWRGAAGRRHHVLRDALPGEAVTRFLGWCLVAVVAAGAAPPDARVRSELEARYDQMAKAFSERDSAAIFALRTPDFCIHYPGGERDSAGRARQVLAYFFSQNLPPIQVRYAIRALSLTSPDVAVCDVFQKGSRYQMLAGKSRLVEHDVKQRETWRRVKGAWMLASIDDIHDRHRWVDGVPVDPAKPFDPGAKPFQTLK